MSRRRAVATARVLSKPERRVRWSVVYGVLVVQKVSFRAVSDIYVAADFEDSCDLLQGLFLQSRDDNRLPSSFEIVKCNARNCYLEIVVASALDRLQLSRRGQNLVAFSQHA
jgi:hypothetical protein